MVQETGKAGSSHPWPFFPPLDLVTLA